jgi:hypothetical protein
MSEKLPTLTFKFRPKGKFIRIIPICCTHIGHANFNEKKLDGYLDYVLKTEDTYAIMLGDSIENVIGATVAKYPGAEHDQTINVEKQRELAYKKFLPLARKGKILAWTESNHSLRSWYAAGFSVEKWLAEKLRVPFCGTDALLKIIVGNLEYTIHATHGEGASTSLPSVFGKLLHQMGRVEGADVYLRGHHHKKVLADSVTIDAKTGLLRKRVLGATGCFMGYLDSYGHRKGLSPVVPGCIKIKLYSERWDVHATL